MYILFVYHKGNKGQIVNSHGETPRLQHIRISVNGRIFIYLFSLITYKEKGLRDYMFYILSTPKIEYVTL